MATRRHPRKKRRTPAQGKGGHWVKDVHTTAIDVPEGTMARTPDEMASILLQRNAGKPAGSINRYMQFHINRAGRGLDADRRAAIRKAMQIIRGRA